MKKILFLLFIATMTNIQGIMAQEKIIQTTEADGKAAFQREMIFPIGEPNTAFAKYFIGNSYLAPISKEQIPFSICGYVFVRDLAPLPDFLYRFAMDIL